MSHQKEALSWYIDLYQMKRNPTEAELAQARESVKKTLENVISAPVYIAVLVDSSAKYADYILYDGTLAAGNLMIAARALGYGTSFFTTFFPEEKMKKFFNIPAQYKLICFTPVGIPEEWPETPPKKSLHFHGHYDVVPEFSPDQFVPRLKGDRLYGRGSSDMKGGLVAMLFTLRAIKECGLELNGKLTFSIVADEETGGRLGTQYLFDSKRESS
jgi:acetylornithine deacetylase/succinyl-diaminopimelate desuccinylase-like protein